MTSSAFLRLALVTLLAVFVAHARKPGPLPHFSLTTPDGVTVKSSQIHLPNRWLLIYVHQNSGHSALVLNSLKDEKPAALGGKIVVIVGGAQAKDVPNMSKKYPHMASVTWYADPRREVLRAFNIHASPFVLGIKQDIVQWSLIGSLPDRAQLKSILKTWKDKDK